MKHFPRPIPLCAGRPVKEAEKKTKTGEREVAEKRQKRGKAK